jgi:hypothetical protein
VSRTNNERSRQLIHAAAKAGAAAMRERGVTDEEADERSVQAKQRNQGRFLPRGGGQPLWTKEQIELLGTLPDAEVAQRIGRTGPMARSFGLATRLVTATSSHSIETAAW